VAGCRCGAMLLEVADRPVALPPDSLLVDQLIGQSMPVQDRGVDCPPRCSHHRKQPTAATSLGSKQHEHASGAQAVL
jgi:hypothetical protein